MLMKDGSVIPRPLADALAGDTRAMKIFMDMSPAYQKLCVARVMRADGETMRERVTAAIEGIHKYGENSRRR